jgi:hypothetical protein
MSAPANTLAPRPSVRARDQKPSQAAGPALEPLKAELVRQAHAVAAERIQRAVAEDATTIARAEREAALILEQARQEGISEASALVAALQIRCRRQARAITLRARAEGLEELRRRSIAAVARLSREPDYPEVRNRLVDYIRAQLGEDAVISDAPTGGVVGTVTGRRLDCSFATLVEQALGERGIQADLPWTI